MSETNATKIWRGRVAAWRASRETAEEFSQGKGWATNTLRHWAWRLGTTKPMAESPIRIVKVGMREHRGSLVIDLGDAGRVVVEATIDHELLATVIAVLDARRSR